MFTVNRWSQASNLIRVAQARKVSPGSDVRLLDRVARELRVPEDEAGDGLQPRDGRADERGEGVMIAPACPFDEIPLVHGALFLMRPFGRIQLHRRRAAAFHSELRVAAAVRACRRRGAASTLRPWPRRRCWGGPTSWPGSRPRWRPSRWVPPACCSSARRASASRRSGPRRSSAPDSGAIGSSSPPAPSRRKATSPTSSWPTCLTPVAADLLPALPPPQSAGLSAALLLERPDRPVDPRVVGTATLAILERLAAERGVLVAIDDLPWVDPASADALGFALRRAWDRGLRVGLLATVRGDADDATPSWVRELPLAPTRVVVGPVSLGVLHHLIRDRIGTTLSRPQLVRLEAASLGNPLLAMELARAIQRQGRWPAPGEPLPVPDDIERLVRDRLDGLPADDRRVLFVVAVASAPTTGLVAAALACPPSDVEDAAARATEAALLEIGPPSGRDDRPALRAPALRRGCGGGHPP